MLQQYFIQYGLNGCCLRAPWIMEKDDLRCHLSFGPDVFGAPRWCDLVGAEAAADYAARGAIPVLLDAAGARRAAQLRARGRPGRARSSRRSTTRGRATSS